jgi:hypothetical protein
MENIPSIEHNPPADSESFSLPAFDALEQAIVETTPETKHIPSWFKQTVKTISDAWFDPKSFEEHPGLYEKLGVRMFKKYMPRGDLMNRLVWKHFGHEDAVKPGDLSSLKNMEAYTRFFETVHMVGFGLGVAGIGLSLANPDTSTLAEGMALGSLGAILNAYPIMLQRYNRVRLYRAIHNMEGHKAGHVSTESENQPTTG